MSTHSLLPSLSALLPVSSHALFLARLSLQAIHIEPLCVQEDVYIGTAPLPNTQPRSLRLRAQRRRVRANLDGVSGHDSDIDGDGNINGHGKDKEELETEFEYEYTVQYLSPPLSGREYAETSVRASFALDVVGCSTRSEIEAFIRGIGFRFSHSFTRQGHLVHLPGPYGTTLHLSITRISLPPSPDNNSTSANVYPAPASSSTSTSTPAPSSEPFFVQLQPSRAVQPVGTARTSASGPDKDIIKELGLTDMMTVLQQVAGRIEGVHWETGR